MNQPLLILALLLAALSCCATSPAQQARTTTTATSVQSAPGSSTLVITSGREPVTVMVGPSHDFKVMEGGKELSADRVRRVDDHLRILDEAGATLYDIRVLPGGGLVYPYDAKVAAMGWPDMESLSTWYESGPPRKIIGVMVDSVEGALASQLDLEPGSAFVISNVSPGLPASKAGLQPHDVVVSIEGEQPASVELLRETLDGKQAGDTVKLGLLRKGQRMDVDVGIAEESEPAYMPGVEYAEAMDLLAEREAEMDAARDRMGEVVAELREAEAALADARARGDSDNEAREELLERKADVEALRAELKLTEEHLRSGAASMGLVDLGTGGRALVLPPNSSVFGTSGPAPLSSEVDERLRSMEERLSRLETLLEKLVESDAAGKK